MKLIKLLPYWPRKKEKTGIVIIRNEIEPVNIIQRVKEELRNTTNNSVHKFDDINEIDNSQKPKC